MARHVWYSEGTYEHRGGVLDRVLDDSSGSLSERVLDSMGYTLKSVGVLGRRVVVRQVTGRMAEGVCTWGKMEERVILDGTLSRRLFRWGGNEYWTVG